MAKNMINSTTSFGDALRGVAKIIFSEDEIKTCSVKGRHTNKNSEKRPPLNVQKVAWMISE